MKNYVKILKSMFQIPKRTRLCKTALFLGAEYNMRYSKNNIHISMQNQVEDWLKTKDNRNPRFFTILEAQLRSLGLIDNNNNMLANIVFDDVSQVKTYGKHSKNSIYRQNVSKSVKYHRSLLEDVRPDIVIIGGTAAFNEYKKQIIGNYNGFLPKVVLKVYNQSPEAHRSTGTWEKHYLSESLGDLIVDFCLNAKSSGLISKPMFLKVSTKCTKAEQLPWLVETV